MTHSGRDAGLPEQRVSSDDEQLLLQYVLEGADRDEEPWAQDLISDDPAARAMYEDMLRTLPRRARRFTRGAPEYQGNRGLLDFLHAVQRTTHPDNEQVYGVIEHGMTLGEAADLAGISVEEARVRLDRAAYWHARYIERRIERWPANMPMVIRRMRDARRSTEDSDDDDDVVPWELYPIPPKAPERPLLPAEQADMRLIHDFILWCRPEDEAEFMTRLDDIHFRCLATCVLLVWT